MFERVIAQTIQKITAETLQERSLIPLADILQDPRIPARIKPFFETEVHWWLYNEHLARAANKRFEYSHPELASLLNYLEQVQIRHARFEREEFISVLDSGVKLTYNYLCRPQTTLKWYIFRGQPVKPLDEVMLRFSAFVDYEYFRTVFIEWVDRKRAERPTFDAISATEFERVIRRTDDQILLNCTVEDLLEMMRPLFEFIGEGDEQKVPVDALVIFFDDKNIKRLVDQLEAYRDRGGADVGREGFVALLDELLSMADDEPETDFSEVYQNDELDDVVRQHLQQGQRGAAGIAGIPEPFLEQQPAPPVMQSVLEPAYQEPARQEPQRPEPVQPAPPVMQPAPEPVRENPAYQAPFAPQQEPAAAHPEPGTTGAMPESLAGWSRPEPEAGISDDEGHLLGAFGAGQFSLKEDGNDPAPADVPAGDDEDDEVDFERLANDSPEPATPEPVAGARADASGDLNDDEEEEEKDDDDDDIVPSASFQEPPAANGVGAEENRAPVTAPVGDNPAHGNPVPQPGHNGATFADVPFAGPLPSAGEAAPESARPPAPVLPGMPDVRRFIDLSLERKVLKKIFGKDRTGYETALDSLNAATNWRLASQVLDEIFIKYNVDPYSRTAIRFTDSIYGRYLS